MEKKEQSKIDKPDIKIRKEASSLNEFVKRNTPTDEEAHEFNKFMEVSQKDDEMEEGLREIYRNDGGEKLDINTLEKRRGLGIIGWLVYLLFILVVLAGLVWGYYNFVYKKATENNSSVSLVVDGPKTILAGEDVVYKIAYSNPTDVSLKKMEIKVVYPDEFVFGESNPVATGDKTLWQIDSVLPGASGVIEIKGKMVGDKGKNEVMLANMTWKSENSEADFRKEQVLETKISDIGLNVTYDIPVSVFAGQAGNFKINIEPQKINYINNFILRFDPAENIVISKISPNLMPEEKYIEKINDNSWRVIGIADGLTSLNIDFKVLKKITPVEKMTMYFEVPENETKSMLLFNKVIDLSIVKNDFNVSLILNGATNQQGVDFGDVLHYSLVFSNNGETDVNDAIVMAVLDGNILDWSTFKSKQSSVVRDGTVSWTFKDSPALKSIKSGGDGVIDFSINVASLDSIKRKMNANSKYEINSYAQYSLGMSGTSTPKESTDTKSNIIKVKLNSDLALSEGVKYFNDDNIAVGSGPTPPQVGETTTYRVFWRVSNNLHKLAGLVVKSDLPTYVTFAKSSTPNIGSLNFDAATNQVVWSIGDQNVSEIDGLAEFDVSVTPGEADKGKVMVLLKGTKIEAQDLETESKINNTIKAKTTKLSDDDIANSDGIVK